MGEYDSFIQGKSFEETVKTLCKYQDILVKEIPTAARWTQHGMRSQKADHDFILIYNGICVFVDLKSHDEKVLNFSRITPHQLKALQATYYKGCNSGYLVWHRPIDTIVFYDAKVLSSCQPGTSLSPADGVYIGGIMDPHLGTLFV